MSDQKPNVDLHVEEYTDQHSGRTYDVYHIGGEINEKHGATTRGPLTCTSCSKTHIYKWQNNDRWIVFSCPICNAISAWWEECYSDEEEEQ
ncbi:hypothetical protein PaeCFBP13512_22425 [Paenibacillus sp. CFBP13512]|uniref:hypothetical protein n=1 Tax=Paenibacillus sp. CFBP13512 TaxID=2184007 RepID=UPI0010C0CF3F|nr:hypothetical protein [Paenibacillus sp. CFBP13512]TKJ83775.1 hypothetical protein PaeCFBP13512_22425 [Paenibacillus sp. CFBP13512]